MIYTLLVPFQMKVSGPNIHYKCFIAFKIMYLIQLTLYSTTIQDNTFNSILYKYTR